MPVQCGAFVGKLSTDELRDLDYHVMRHAFNSQNELGRLADERIYQLDLAARLQAAGLAVKREIRVQLSHREYRRSLYLDLIVSDRAIYELKVVSAISEFHIGQLLTYLHLFDSPRGKLINFRSPKVESQFVNAPLPSSQRRSFTVDHSGYDGDSDFLKLVVGLLRDWGTSLTLSLYHDALVTLLGGADIVESILPINRCGISLGTQRFHLVGPNIAFQLTSLNHGTSEYRSQLARLIQFSPLKAIHWVNIAHHEVTLATISS